MHFRKKQIETLNWIYLVYIYVTPTHLAIKEHWSSNKTPYMLLWRSSCNSLMGSVVWNINAKRLTQLSRNHTLWLLRLIANWRITVVLSRLYVVLIPWIRVIMCHPFTCMKLIPSLTLCTYSSWPLKWSPLPSFPCPLRLSSNPSSRAF